MGKYIIVGATSGIGADLAGRLMNNGHQVISISRSEHGPDGASHIRHDVTEEEFPTDTLPDNIDGFAYCPGTINLKPLRSLKIRDFQKDLDVNYLGAVKAAKAIVPKLKKDGGSVVFFSTVAVQQGMPFHASVAGAKGAIEGFARSLAAELAPSIRVNCIAPSLTDTPMAERLLSNASRRESSEERHPLKMIGEPSDIAAIAEYLLSDNARWMTGQVLGVDGGMSSVRV